jgi:hypothetical protein
MPRQAPQAPPGFNQQVWEQAWQRSFQSAIGPGAAGYSQQRHYDLATRSYNQLYNTQQRADEDRQRRLDQFQLDPNTGLVMGDQALPDADIAPEIQARQDRLMVELQQRKLKDATRMQMGALGLMQSYRPGGGAALEANVYGQAAQSMRVEAGAFMPTDLLYEVRQDAAEQARRQADRASKRGFFASLVQGAATVVGGIYGGPAGAAAGAAVGGALTGGAQLAPEPGQAGAGGGPMTPASPTTMPATVQPEGAGSGAAGAGAAPAGPAAPSGPADASAAPVVGGLGLGTDAPGAAGDFSPASFAAAAARSYSDPLMAGIIQTAVSEYIADMYDSDPFWPTIDAQINQLMQGAAE